MLKRRSMQLAGLLISLAVLVFAVSSGLNLRLRHVEAEMNAQSKGKLADADNRVRAEHSTRAVCRAHSDPPAVSPVEVQPVTHQSEFANVLSVSESEPTEDGRFHRISILHTKERDQVRRVDQELVRDATGGVKPAAETSVVMTSSYVETGTVTEAEKGTLQSRNVALAQLSAMPQQNSSPAPAPVHFKQVPQPPPPDEWYPSSLGQAAPSGMAQVTAAKTYAVATRTVTSLQALSDNDSAIPPDTYGAVGPNHLMVVHNSEIRIQTRAGAELLRTSLNNFWGLSNFSPALTDVFDPRVVYDAFAQRWIVSSGADAFLSSSRLLLAVSKTSDPTGAWTEYAIPADATNTGWADYPQLGFSRDYVVLTANIFPLSVGASAPITSNVYILDRNALYSNTANSYTVYSLSNLGFTHTPSVTYDPNQGTLYLLQDWNGNSSGKGFLRLYTITGPPATAQLTVGPFIGISATWAADSPAPNFGPQLGSTAKISTGDSRMQKVVYRGNSLWAAQTVFLPASAPTRSSVQWYQISLSTATPVVQQFGRIDDSSGANFYAFPSIAVNRRSDVLVGYAKFSATQYAGGYCAYHLGTDAAGTLRAETIVKAGEAPYFKTFGGAENRWGDYSNSVVDPLNDLEFWTIQEYAAAPVAGESRWGTWWGRVLPRVRQTDFDGDGKADIAVFQPSNSTFYVLPSNGQSSYKTAFGQGTLYGGNPIPVTGDFDGDLLNDLCVYQPSDSTFYIKPANGAPTYKVQFGQGTASGGHPQPLAADFDGDGKTDLVVFQPDTSTFYVKYSSGIPDAVIQFGQGRLYGGNPTALAGDFDGDGRMDFAVFQPSDSTFYIRPANGTPTYKTQFGQGTLYGGNPQPLAGDFDGDGKTDLVVFQPTTSTFYVKYSSGIPGAAVPFGQGTLYGGNPIPVVADFDGDGRTDFVVFQTSDSTFYIKPANGNPAYKVAFGQGTLYGGNPVPLPNGLSTK